MANEKRLVDANALLEEQRIMYHYSRIENAPTVEAVEVVHGRWLINPDGYYPYCSECKNEPKGGEMTDYCPKCGAKMDGGNENG